MPVIEAAAIEPDGRATAEDVLEVEDLYTYIATGDGVVRAVDGVSFALREGEILGLVGESGSGKSVTCRTIAGLMPSPPARSIGEVRYTGYPGRNLLELRPAETGVASSGVAIGVARAADPQQLGGEAARRERVDWKRWTLWGSLVLGVVVLGWMALRLARQISKTA